MAANNQVLNPSRFDFRQIYDNDDNSNISIAEAAYGLTTRYYYCLMGNKKEAVDIQQKILIQNK